MPGDPIGESQPGPGVDRAGNPVVDPTQNVLDLVEAAVKRLDDIRKLEAKHARRESEHIREILQIRNQHFKELRDLERLRIDAIRSVDIAAVQRDQQVASTLAATLAEQVRTTAQTTRAEVAAITDPIRSDIADLRRYQWSGEGGKAQVGESRLNIGMVVGAAGLLIAMISVAVLIIVATRTS